MYELDVRIPDDWKLKVSIMNKGLINKEIGHFIVDIEDRILGISTSNYEFLKNYINLKGNK
jgi:hypothetical protein